MYVSSETPTESSAAWASASNFVCFQSEARAEISNLSSSAFSCSGAVFKALYHSSQCRDLISGFNIWCRLIDPSVNLDKERSFVGSGRITPSGMNTTSIGQSRCLAARLSCTDRVIITSHIRRQIACTRLSFCRAIVVHPAAQKTTAWLAQPKALVLRNVASYQRNFVSQSFEMLRALGDSSVKVIILSSAWS